VYQRIFAWIGALGRNQWNLWRNKARAGRRLEIGPGSGRVEGFETLDTVGGWNVDYVCDAAEPLPFADGVFELIYASHVLEHIPWYRTERVVQEWVRVLESGGVLEVWVPDGLKIAKAFVDAELEGRNYIEKDGWYRFNDERDPCKWANGRLFSYGDGTGKRNHYNWHLAMFSERYLVGLFDGVGLTDVRRLESGEVRGYDHGWINLGVAGTKK
jgi:SAM-dependent methyltransferase